ncbi:MAG: hypothetical protein COA47_15155 [Robiginitomaculum sp.]|nr:MAG: hypothetical protein COA47_15155 [Robiginitomaculum sp.]
MAHFASARLCIALLLLVAASLLAVSSARADTLTMDNGEVRRWQSFAPSRIKGQTAPLLFVLHGGGGSSKATRRTFSFDQLARRKGFRVIYPDGLERHWNDGRDAGSVKLFKGTKPDDVGFLTALAQQMIDNGQADPHQIYVIGVSNGGMMTQRLLCEASQTFAGGVAIIAGLPTTMNHCQPTRPGPVLLINGDADPIIPWAGGGVGLRRNRGDVLSAMDSFAHWQRVNQCQGPVTRFPMFNRDRNDGTRPLRHRASDCQSGHAVELIQIKGGGHGLPGKKARGNAKAKQKRTKLLGPTSNDFDTRSIAWDFLQTRSKPGH